MTPDSIRAVQAEIHALRQRFAAAVDADEKPSIELHHALGHLHNAQMDLERARTDRRRTAGDCQGDRPVIRTVQVEIDLDEFEDGELVDEIVDRLERRSAEVGMELRARLRSALEESSELQRLLDATARDIRAGRIQPTPALTEYLYLATGRIC